MRIGIARTDITPEGPVWLTGYANRDRKSEGVYAPLYGGAIYLEGADGSDGSPTDRALILTADVIGFSPPADATFRQAISDVTGLLPRQVVLTATHTHCAPFFTPWVMPGEMETGYAAFLQRRLQDAALAAIRDAVDGRVAFSRARSSYGINRRRADAEGVIRMLPNPDGPIDRDLDTLWLHDAGGDLLGSLSVYGCHPTSLAGYLVGPDYPGFLCRHLERQTAAPAFFATGCAGDVRPWYGDDPDVFPRPDLATLEAAGAALADEVLSARGDAVDVDAEALRIDRVVHRLPYQARPTRQELEAVRDGDDPYKAPWAVIMLERLEAGDLPDASPHEIQVLQLNDGFRAVFLGGEVLSEIGLHIKRVLQPGTTMAVAYSNGLIAYVPSAAAHPLGGYEVDGSHFYFHRPAPFTADCEHLIVEQTKGLVSRLAARR